MIIHPSLPGGFTIFCDDIRQEVNGKITLVGAYANELNIHGTAPASLQKLSMLVVFRFDPKEVPSALTLRVLFDPSEGDEVVLFEAETQVRASVEEAAAAQKLVEADGNQRFGEMRSFLAIGNIAIPSAGHVKVRAFVADDEIRLGALAISFAPPTENQPTSTH